MGILHRSQKVVYTFGSTAILAVSFHRLEACAPNLCYYNFVFAIAWPGEKCKIEFFMDVPVFISYVILTM